MRIPSLILLALGVCAATACTKNPDSKPTPKSMGAAPVTKAAPTTAGTPAGPTASKPKVGLPQTCNLGPCHGLDNLTCTAGAPMMCTDIYKHGDFCRQFVKCGQVDGACALQADAKFAECKACMDGCKTKLTCEATCRDQLKVP